MKAALLPIVLALSAGAAYAEGPIQGNEVFNFSPTLSRAEVQAQAVQSNRDGLVARGESTPVANTGATSGLSRAQVIRYSHNNVADLRASRVFATAS